MVIVFVILILNPFAQTSVFFYLLDHPSSLLLVEVQFFRLTSEYVIALLF